ncbi:MAG: DUF6728 family protein [Cytophagales bacterium]|nr:DUF6728 family protein [Cytophagales bacterium]
MKQYFDMGEVFTYFFRKKDASRPSNFNIKAMHFINKLSMTIFLLCIAVLLYRLIK